MVAKDGVPLGDVVDKLSVVEYRRLDKDGFDFNNLKKSKILSYSSLEGTDLERWGGKETGDLIESIYDKVIDLKIRFPRVGSNQKYRWGARVSNIRKRIWLLLTHVIG